MSTVSLDLTIPSLSVSCCIGWPIEVYQPWLIGNILDTWENYFRFQYILSFMCLPYKYMVISTTQIIHWLKYKLWLFIAKYVVLGTGWKNLQDSDTDNINCVRIPTMDTSWMSESHILSRVHTHFTYKIQHQNGIGPKYLYIYIRIP